MNWEKMPLIPFISEWEIGDGWLNGGCISVNEKQEEEEEEGDGVNAALLTIWMLACLDRLSVWLLPPNLYKHTHTFPSQLPHVFPLLFLSHLIPPPSAPASFLSPFFSLLVSQSQ